MSESLRAPQRLAQLTTNELLLAAVVACQEEAGEYVLRPVLKNLSVSFEDKWFAKSHAACDTRLMRHNMLNASAGGHRPADRSRPLRRQKINVADARHRASRTSVEWWRPSKRRPHRAWRPAARRAAAAVREDASPSQPSEEASPISRRSRRPGHKRRRGRDTLGGAVDLLKRRVKEQRRRRARASEEAAHGAGPPPASGPCSEKQSPREAAAREAAARSRAVAREAAAREAAGARRQWPARTSARRRRPASPRGGRKSLATTSCDHTPRRSGGVFTDSFRNELADVWWPHIKQALRVDTIAKLESEHGVGSALRGPAAIRKVHVVLTVLEHILQLDADFPHLRGRLRFRPRSRSLHCQVFPRCGAPLHSSDLFFTPYDEGGSDAGIAEQIECIIFDASNPRLCLGSGKC